MKHILFLIYLFFSCGMAAQVRHFTAKDGLLTNQIRQLVSLPNHQIFVVTEGAFFLFDGQQFVEQSCRYDSVMVLPAFGCHDFMWEGDSLLCLKNFYNLFLYDVREKRFVYGYDKYLKNASLKTFVHTDGEQRTAEKVHGLDIYRDGLRGILKLDADNNDNVLRAYCKDWQGGEWYGLEAGGIFYNPSSSPLAKTICLGEIQPELHDARFVENLGNQRLLIVSKHGIFTYHLGTNECVVLSKKEISCTNLYKDAIGGVWISSLQGLFYYKDEKLTHVAPENTTGFQHSHMRFAVPMQDHRLLVCHLKQQLGYFDLESRHFDCFNRRLPQLDKYRVMIDALLYGQNDMMLVITQNGAFLLDTQKDTIAQLPESKEIERFTSKYNCALRDSKGRIWLGTQNGLFWLVPQISANGSVKGYSIHRTTYKDGLSNNCIESIAEDANGNVWIGTSYGINCIKLSNDTLRIIRMGQSDGVPNVEMLERASCVTEDGKVCFLSYKGLIVVDNHKIKDSSETFETCPLLLKAHGMNLPLDKAKLKLAYNEFPLELEFSALNYASPEHTHYRYRLSGLQDVWQYDKSGRGMTRIVYNALAPGSYLFEIQATLDNGEWGPRTVFHLVVAPPWWRSWWAICFYAIILIFIAAYSISRYLRYRKRQMERENEEKVNQLFELQSKARYNFAQNVQLENKHLDVQQAQPLLAERMAKCIADNMDNIDYTVDTLARDLAMSRASLYKKAQDELGITPNEFMRNIRLKHALSLLEKGIPVNQVSLMVGFQTPYYFSKCFKTKFGITPSLFHKRNEK